MGQADGIADVRSLLGEAFKATRAQKSGDDVLARRFPGLPALPQASEVVAYRVAGSALVEVARVVEHLQESDAAFSSGEQDWATVAHVLAYAAIFKAWRALNAAFKAAKDGDATAGDTPDTNHPQANPSKDSPADVLAARLDCPGLSPSEPKPEQPISGEPSDDQAVPELAVGSAPPRSPAQAADKQAAQPHYVVKEGGFAWEPGRGAR